MTLKTLLAIAALGIAPLSLSAQTTAPSTRPAFEPTPASLDELRSIERDVSAVLEKVMPSVVGVQVGGSQGSGVIVSRDGYVLTAGHVSGPAGQQCTLILEGGRRVRGITLGRDSSIDSGMIKITDPGEYPAAEMGISVALIPGQWVIALGHPGGYRPGRPAVLRLGRVLDAQERLIVTDNTLVGGDSGGPLFDLEGKVVGIHSRIGMSLLTNIHVPIDTYTETWERLARSEEWGGRRIPGFTPTGPVIGINGEDDPRGLRVIEVSPNLPAAAAGLRVGDIITSVEGHKIGGLVELQMYMRRRTPGVPLTFQILRGDNEMTIRIAPMARNDVPSPQPNPREPNR